MSLPLYAGRYQLEELLGQGGMGLVYRATDRRTGGAVAVKVISRALAEDGEYLERLRREARITASLSSPRVVRVIDLDEHDGAPFIVLEYVAGPTLAELLSDQGPFEPTQAAVIGLEVARALEAAHARGIVHRDLKPENVKLVEGQVKVLDFGIARSEVESGVTITGVYHGTPAYSAPERIGGSGDIRSDIYALGAMLFELLTGAPPYDGPTAMAILFQHATAPAPELPAVIPAPLRALVGRCLAKSPLDRYQTPAGLVAALITVIATLPRAAGLPTIGNATSQPPGAWLPPAPVPDSPPPEQTVPIEFTLGKKTTAPSTVQPVAPSPRAIAAKTQALPEDVRRPGAEPRGRSPHRWMWAGLATAGIVVVAAGGTLATRSLWQGDEGSPGTTATSPPSSSGVVRPSAVRVQVMTLAGSGGDGGADGQGVTAQLSDPAGIAVDRAGTVYFVDGARIRRVSPGGEVITLAGSVETGFVNGVAISARFNTPRGIAVDRGGTLYIADQYNHSIRTLSPDGVVRTLAGTGAEGYADGPGSAAQFNLPHGVAVGADGTVYVADTGNNRIRKISAAGVVSTLAGGGTDSNVLDGPGAQAQFANPNGVAVDSAGTVYVADSYNARIRAISREGVVRTLAGSGEDGSEDGPVATAQFSDPVSVAVDAAGNVYVLDMSERVRQVTADGQVRTLAGAGAAGYADGPGAEARFNGPVGIAVAEDGRVYIADTGNRRIRVVVPAP